MRVSLALVTYNEGPELLDLLRGIFAQDASSRPIEVIVVHNGGKNATLERLEEAEKLSPIPFRWIINRENNLGLARRIAVEASQGDWVAFTDPDCLLPDGWLHELKTQWRQQSQVYPRLAGVGGPNQLPSSTEFGSILNLMLTSPLGNGGSPQAENRPESRPVDHLPTTNALYIRTALLEVGNFSPVFVHTCEDGEIGQRLLRANYFLVQVPSPKVINDSAKNIQEWNRRLYRFGYSQVTLLCPLRKSFHWPSLLSALGIFAILPLAILGFWYSIGWMLILGYGFLISLEAMHLTWRHKMISAFLPLVGAFGATHFSYGLGSARGYVYRFNSLFLRPLKLTRKFPLDD